MKYCAADIKDLTRQSRFVLAAVSGEQAHALLTPRDQQGLEIKVGAGDTVIATVAVMLASGETLPNAMRLANRAAGIVVGKLGTATCSIEELRNA